MALFVGDHNIIPHHISASSAKGLENKIKQLQALKGMEYKFINFYFDSVKGEHVGWYYEKVYEFEQLSGAINAKATE